MRPRAGGWSAWFAGCAVMAARGVGVDGADALYGAEAEGPGPMPLALQDMDKGGDAGGGRAGIGEAIAVRRLRCGTVRRRRAAGGFSLALGRCPATIHPPTMTRGLWPFARRDAGAESRGRGLVVTSIAARRRTRRWKSQGERTGRGGAGSSSLWKRPRQRWRMSIPTRRR